MELQEHFLHMDVPTHARMSISVSTRELPMMDITILLLVKSLINSFAPNQKTLNVKFDEREV